MTHKKLELLIGAGAIGLMAIILGGPVTGQQQQPPPRVGTPLPGLTEAQVKLFQSGLEDFLESEEEKDGLGPAFNGTGCAGCHNQPAIGGVGNNSVIRAGFLQNGRFEAPMGGSLIHLSSLPNHRCQPRVPQNANVMTHRIPTPVFGAGLVEAIPDATIQGLEDPNDRDGDGVSGRAAVIDDIATRTRRVGRFGWKAQQATLLAFAGDAYVNEMGITNDLFPSEVGAGLSPQQLADCDTVPDPEDQRDPATGLRGIDQFENFMKVLAPPQRGQAGDNVRRGEQIFVSVGCAGCHVPALATGPNTVPALDRKAVPAFSDFLLHDIGTGDGIAQAAAEPNEFRTAPLWGLRFRKQLMHDGRALSVGQAIRMHGVEARTTRDHYDAMGEADRRALLDFLGSL